MKAVHGLHPNGQLRCTKLLPAILWKVRLQGCSGQASGGSATLELLPAESDSPAGETNLNKHTSSWIPA